MRFLVPILAAAAALAQENWPMFRGAAAYLLLEQAIGSYTTHWQVIFGPILILVVLFARRGLFGLFAGKPPR